MAENINIAGRLHSTATGNIVAGANEIYDDTKGKKQSVVNAETDTTLADHNSRINALNSQNYVYLEAESGDTLADVFDGVEGAVDTLYRVAKWDGNTPEYNTTVYSEYIYNATTETFKCMDVKEYGIDDEPTAGSENLVKSGGIKNYVDSKFSVDIKTTDLLTITGVYQIVNNAPAFISTSGWKHELISIDELREVSLWCTTSSGNVGVYIPAVLYLSGNDIINDYISCEYADQSDVPGTQIGRKNGECNIPSNAKYAVLQTSVTYTTDSDICKIYKITVESEEKEKKDIKNIQDSITSIKTLDLLVEDNVYKIDNGAPVLLTTTAWGHRILPVSDFVGLSVWCSPPSGISGNKIPGIIYLSGENVINNYISCEYGPETTVQPPFVNKKTIHNIPNNATHVLLQTSKAYTTDNDYCNIYTSLLEKTNEIDKRVVLLENMTIKTLDLLINDNVYKIVNNSPVLLESTQWANMLISVDDLKKISLWATTEAGIGGNKIPAIIYASSEDVVDDYISCEYAPGDSPSGFANKTSFTIPSGAKFALLQTSKSYTVNTDVCVLTQGYKTYLINEKEDRKRIGQAEEDIALLKEAISQGTIIKVDKSGDTGTYSSLSAAMSAAKSGDTIQIYDGIYEEYHVELKRGVKVVGIGNVEIKGYLPTNVEDFVNKVTQYSTLEAEQGCDLENLTVTAQNLRYPIHAQSLYSNEPSVWNVKNCKFIHHGNEEAYQFAGSFVFRAISAWGGGTYGGDKLYIDGCTFMSKMRAFSIHNGGEQNDPSRRSRGSLFALVNNSTFISIGLDQDGTKHEFNDVIHIQSIWSKTPDIVVFNGCKANGYLNWHIDYNTSGSDMVPSLETYITGTDRLKMAFNVYGGISNSFYDTSVRAAEHLDYYPKINGEMEEWVNTGLVNIPRGYCVAKSADYGIKLWDNTCTIDDFVGIALDNISVNNAGNVKVKNYIHKIYAGFAYDAAMNAGDSIYIDSNGKPTLTQTSFEIGKVFDSVGNILLK